MNSYNIFLRKMLNNIIAVSSVMLCITMLFVGITPVMQLTKTPQSKFRKYVRLRQDNTNLMSVYEV